MKYVGGIRKELGIRTVFNILGPLTNPARPRRILLGVYDPSLAEPLAQMLMKLGVERGPMRNVVLLNAGTALYIGGKAEDLAALSLETLRELCRVDGPGNGGRFLAALKRPGMRYRIRQCGAARLVRLHRQLLQKPPELRPGPGPGPAPGA